MSKKQHVYAIFTTAIMTIALLFVAPSAQVNATEYSASTNVPTDKTWTISFSSKIDPQENFYEYIEVIDENGQQQDVTIQSEDPKKLKIYPPDNGYEPSTTYKIIAKEGLQSLTGSELSEETIKQFTTSSVKAADEFQVRPDAKNEITYVDSFKQLTEQQVQQTNYDAGTITISAAANVGDFLALPPTEQYPNGFVAEVTDVQSQNGASVITFTNADVEDYVADIDISTIVEVDASHVTLNEELFGGPVASFNAVASSNGRIEKLSNGFKIHLIDFTETFTKDYKGNKKGIAYDIEGKGSLAFDADFKFDNPEFFYDNGKMGFSADQTFSFDAKVDGTLEGTIEYEIANIGIPKLHVNLSDNKMGVYATLSLVITLDGKGNASFEIVEKHSTTASYSKSKGAQFNVKKKDSESTSINESLNISGEFNTEISLPLSIGFYLFDDQLGKVGVRPVIGADLKAQTKYTELLERQKACAKFVVYAEGKAEFELTLSKKIQDKKTITLVSGELFNWSNCNIRGLEMSDSSIDLEPNKSHTLTLSAIIDKKTQKLNLPKSAITWKSSNPKVIVSNSGVVTVSKAAKAGETATITATLKNDDKTYKATTKVYVISNERPETYLFLNGDDKITSIVNGRGQTFGTDYYQAEENYVPGAYKLTLPFGDYIINLKRKDGSTTKYGYSVIDDPDVGVSSGSGPYFENKLLLKKEDFFDYVYDPDLLKIKGVSFKALNEVIKDDPMFEKIMNAKVVNGAIEISRIKDGYSIITVTWEEEGNTYDENFYVGIIKHLDGYMLYFPY